MTRLATALVLLAGCATSARPAQPTQTAPPLSRHRPDDAEVERAFAAVADRAAACVGGRTAGLRATGWFDGDFGRYHVARLTVGVPVDRATGACLLDAIESSRVRPFDAVRRDADFTVPTPADGGAGPPHYATVDLAAVDLVVRGRLASFRRCYEAELAHRPGLTGTVRLALTLDQAGHVTHTASEVDDPAMAPVGACMERDVAGLQFPALATPESDFVFPFHFTPGSD